MHARRGSGKLQDSGLAEGKSARVKSEPVDQTTTSVGPRIMTLRDVFRYLYCHYFTIHRLLGKRAIPAFRLGSD
jgi:hypothetical protein